MWYEGGKIASGVGKLNMYYQPLEEPMNGVREKVLDLIDADWFTVGKTGFYIIAFTPFDQYAEETAQDSGLRYQVISKADFKKILQSLKVLR